MLKLTRMPGLHFIDVWKLKIVLPFTIFFYFGDHWSYLLLKIIVHTTVLNKRMSVISHLSSSPYWFFSSDFLQKPDNLTGSMKNKKMQQTKTVSKVYDMRCLPSVKFSNRNWLTRQTNNKIRILKNHTIKSRNYRL